MSLDANSSSTLLEDTLLLGERFHALARRRLSPCTVERHRLEHRSVHLDLLNHVLQTWRTGVLSNWRSEGSHYFAVPAATVGSRPSFP